MALGLALVEWIAAIAAAGMVAEARASASAVPILIAALCGLVAVLARSLAMRRAGWRATEVLYARLRLASNGGGPASPGGRA